VRKGQEASRRVSPQFGMNKEMCLNACNAFIPQAVSVPVIRNKAVLHVLDGVKGLYHGGPFARPQFVWSITLSRVRLFAGHLISGG
jgi:hypothetical protein